MRQRSRAGKLYCTCVQLCLTDGAARKHLKHGEECHMLAKCAFIKTHAAPLSDLSFTANIFQLPTLAAFTVSISLKTDCAPKVNTGHEHVLTLVLS